MSNWLEITITVNGELAEAVAEVLARYVEDGVVVESTAVTAGPEDEGGRAVGPLRVCAYLPVDEHLEETRRRIEEALWYLGRISADTLGPLPAPEYKPIQEVNWMEAWKEHYHPIPVGERLIIVPAWLENPASQRLPIRIDPGMAFGTGTHPTTQLCLELLDWVDQSRSFASQSNPSVIDVGCGSGILAIAALKLGAERALGVDIDPLAVEAASQNAQTNGVSERLELGIGSVKELRLGQFSLQQAEIVFANILAPVIVRLFDDGLADLLVPAGQEHPGGVLILSGILAEQSPEVEAAAVRHGLTIVERRQMGDWVALATGRNSWSVIQPPS
jgi:ribosomal protein L11 methyltransferase